MLLFLFFFYLELQTCVSFSNWTSLHGCQSLLSSGLCMNPAHGVAFCPESFSWPTLFLHPHILPVTKSCLFSCRIIICSLIPPLHLTKAFKKITSHGKFTATVLWWASLLPVCTTCNVSSVSVNIINSAQNF